MAGMSARNQMKKRIVILRQFLLLLETVQTQISFINTDLFSLFSYLSENKSINELTFVTKCFESLSKTDDFELLWADCINNFKSPLTKDDSAIILSFGRQLGKSDTEGQIRNCQIHKYQIENQITDAEEKYKKYGNLYLKLGVLSGFLIVIVLL